MLKNCGTQLAIELYTAILAQKEDFSLFIAANERQG
jgi:hypothetical protein